MTDSIMYHEGNRRMQMFSAAALWRIALRTSKRAPPLTMRTES